MKKPYILYVYGKYYNEYKTEFGALQACTKLRKQGLKAQIKAPYSVDMSTLGDAAQC